MCNSASEVNTDETPTDAVASRADSLNAQEGSSSDGEGFKTTSPETVHATEADLPTAVTTSSKTLMRRVLET